VKINVFGVKQARRIVIEPPSAAGGGAGSGSAGAGGDGGGASSGVGRGRILIMTEAGAVKRALEVGSLVAIEAPPRELAAKDGPRSVTFRFSTALGDARRTLLFTSPAQRDEFVAEVEKLQPRLVARRRDGTLLSETERAAEAAALRRGAAEALDGLRLARALRTGSAWGGDGAGWGSDDDAALEGDSGGSAPRLAAAQPSAADALGGIGSGDEEEEVVDDSGASFYALEENRWGLGEARVLSFVESAADAPSLASAHSAAAAAKGSSGSGGGGAGSMPTPTPPAAASLSGGMTLRLFDASPAGGGASSSHALRRLRTLRGVQLHVRDRSTLRLLWGAEGAGAAGAVGAVGSEGTSAAAAAADEARGAGSAAPAPPAASADTVLTFPSREARARFVAALLAQTRATMSAGSGEGPGAPAGGAGAGAGASANAAAPSPPVEVDARWDSPLPTRLVERFDATRIRARRAVILFLSLEKRMLWAVREKDCVS
jgi:hypothetical protein